MPIRWRNYGFWGGATADIAANAYQALHEPFGDFGVWNGQFETGPGSGSPSGWPEGWEVTLYAGGSVTRVAGGLAGNWCMEGGQAGMGAGGYITSLCYIPVDEARDYYVSAAVIDSSAAGARVALGAACYTAAKVYISTVWALPNTVLPVTWTRYQRRIGPNGDVAWPANTRYCRVVAELQNDNTLIGQFAYVDDVQFQQDKASYSPQIRLMGTLITDDTAQDFKDTAYALYPNSAMTITLEEPGYIWAFYSVYYFRNRTSVRGHSHSITVYCDAALTVPAYSQWWGSPVIDNRHAVNFTVRTQLLAAGAHTIDLRVRVQTAGDTVQGQYVRGYCYYTRAY